MSKCIPILAVILGAGPKSYLKEALGPPYLANWLLVVVGVVAGVLAWLTLRRISDQVKSGKVAADAALLNAQASIASERPLITIEVVKSSTDFFQIRARNCGKTPAEIITHGNEHAFIAGNNILPETPHYYFDGLIDVGRRIVGPGEEFIVSDPLFISAMRDGGPQLMKEVDQGQTHLLYWGKVVYVSALIKERKELDPYETRWCFRYLPGNPSSLISHGKWEYNQNT